MITVDLPLIAAGAIVFVGGMMRGFSGFGVGMVIITGLSIVYRPVDAVIVFSLLEIPAAIQLLPTMARQAQWRRVIPIIVAALAMIPVGAWVLITADPVLMKRAIALFVLAVVTLLAAGWRYHGTATTGTLLAVGSASGFMTGSAGLGGPPVILFFLSGQSRAVHIRANLQTILILSTLVALVVYALHGALDMERAIRALVLTPPYVAAIWLGTRLFGIASETIFRRIALAIVTMMAVSALLS